jgi:hypothetical protein
MEKRINSRTRQHQLEFKNKLKDKIIEDITILQSENKQVNLSLNEFAQNLITYIYEYKNIEFTSQDFQKRKRIKNIVPLCDRCAALRANKDRCTRRKKEGSIYCGTHIKGIPHGKVDSNNIHQSKVIKQVIAQEIQGIIYYIDNEKNVYDPTDIIQNKTDPKIIANYTLTNGKYSIPSLFT